VEKKVVNIIRGEPMAVQLDYMRIIGSLVGMADKYNELSVSTCRYGFAVPLRTGQILRCAVIGEKRLIHIYSYQK
jgi:hypothetical protein